MNGYVGQRARKRRFRQFTYPIYLLLILLLFYFFYYEPSFDRNEKIQQENLNDTNGNQIIIQNDFTVDKYELKIFEKDKQINSLNKTIQSKGNEINNLIAEKNLLIKDNQNYIVEIQSLNSQIEEKFINKENQINNKIDNLTETINKIESEKQTILREYKEVANENLKFKLLAQSLDEKIKELSNLIIAQKKTISEQENIIQKLNDISHHH